MTHAHCAAPPGTGMLLAWWLGELDDAAAGHVEEHLLGCGACSAHLQALVDVGGDIRALVRHGGLRAVLPGAFADRLAAAGLRVREYRVPRNGAVHCTVAPEDDLLVTRLEGPLAGVDRVDIALHDSASGRSERWPDVPFDAAAAEVVFAPDLAVVRALPQTTQRMQLIAVEGGVDRVLGEYIFHHVPWEARADSPPQW